MSTWAVKQDLYDRFGQEKITKLAIRRNWDNILKEWIASEADVDIAKIVNLALEDAKSLIQQKLACQFEDYYLVEEQDFPAVKIWHMKMTLKVLEAGGDCTACDCTDLDKFICGQVCAPNGVCLNSLTSAISVSVPDFPCEGCGCGGCKCC